VKQLLDGGWAGERDLKDIDERVSAEVDEATDGCVDEPLPEPATALPGVYAEPPAAERLWYRSV
jgi:TPP-dependent pyruvate/acetoin dehydrogenase alpha subunit